MGIPKFRFRFNILDGLESSVLVNGPLLGNLSVPVFVNGPPLDGASVGERRRTEKVKEVAERDFPDDFFGIQFNGYK